MTRTAGTLLVLLAVVAGAAEVPVGDCGPITRRHDHVEIRVRNLGRLRGTPVDQLAVLAVRDRVARPIPHQLDESRGRKPTLEGRGARVDQHPGELDFDDVLLLLPCDAGERASASERARWASELGITQWREIRIHDPLTDRAAWAYVVVAPEPPRNPTRYVDYADTDLVSTAIYRIGMAGALPVFFAMVDTDGRATPNLLDGLRLRADGVLRGGLSHVAITERDARHELTASGEGPIRVVRRSEHHIDLGLGLEIGVGTAHTYFYPRRISGPGKMSLPMSPGWIFARIEASGAVDLDGLHGWTYEAAGLTEPFAIDGRTSDAERDFAPPGRWFVLRDGPRAMLTVMRASESLEREATVRLLYADDAASTLEGERLPGRVPLVGFQASDLQTLPAGRYGFTFEVLFEPAWTPGRAQELLRQLDTPLVVELIARSDRADAPAARP